MIYAADVSVDGNWPADAGYGFIGKCPICGHTIHVAESQWWETRCSCGYTWILDIKIVGIKDGDTQEKNKMQSKRQKRENALEYWEKKHAEYQAQFGNDNPKTKNAKQQIAFLKIKLNKQS